MRLTSLVAWFGRSENGSHRALRVEPGQQRALLLLSIAPTTRPAPLWSATRRATASRSGVLSTPEYRAGRCPTGSGPVRRIASRRRGPRFSGDRRASPRRVRRPPGQQRDQRWPQDRPGWRTHTARCSAVKAVAASKSPLRARLRRGVADDHAPTQRSGSPLSSDDDGRVISLRQPLGLSRRRSGDRSLASRSVVSR